MEAHASDYYNSSSSITTDNIYPEQSGYEGDDWQQEHPNDDSIETIKAMVILWVLLLAFYCYDERRSRQLALEQTAMSEQRLQRTLQRLSEERRFDPERRKKEINEQIVTKVSRGVIYYIKSFFQCAVEFGVVLYDLLHTWRCSSEEKWPSL